jgi:hypothetical protein
MYVLMCNNVCIIIICEKCNIVIIVIIMWKYITILILMNNINIQ